MPGNGTQRGQQRERFFNREKRPPGRFPALSTKHFPILLSAPRREPAGWARAYRGREEELTNARADPRGFRRLFRFIPNGVKIGWKGDITRAFSEASSFL
jgi:hypothetical protein